MICCGSRVPAPRIWTVAAYSLAVINLVSVYLYDLLLYEQGRPPPLPWEQARAWAHARAQRLRPALRARWGDSRASPGGSEEVPG